MRKPFRSLLLTQFLSAFTDGAAILVIAFMLKNSLKTHDDNNPYIFLVETFFLFAYILFAPFVGTFADRNEKSRVLFVGNTVKALGILLLIMKVDPAFCYGIIGIGAAIYGPAKYGILKELTTTEDELLDANGKIESTTILAIILGTLAGGILSAHTTLGEMCCLAIYILSILLALKIPAKEGNKELEYRKEAFLFFRDVREAFRHFRMKFSLIGSGSFWMISVVIKNGLLLWIPVHLGIKSGLPFTAIIGMTAIGIVIGALLAKKFTSIQTFYRANRYGWLVAVFAILFPFVAGGLIALVITYLLLLCLGVFAGMYVIPLNATLQEEGHQVLGVGKTIAVQNFIDNTFMLFGTYSVYLLNAHFGFSVMASLVTFGFVYLLIVLYLGALSKKRRNKL